MALDWWLSEYGLFLAQGVTVAVLALIVLGAFGRGIAGRRRPEGMADDGELLVLRVNDKYRQLSDTLDGAAGEKGASRRKRRAARKQRRLEAADPSRKRIYLLRYHGDVRASQTDALRWELTAALSRARASDEIVVCVESAGGVVHGYGLAAAQLERIRQRGVPLTVCVDKVAASGGYLMACVADTIISAPFALIGSIGVVAQLPNFNRWLKRHDIDYEMMTAGEHKRNLSMFGPNTDQGREKTQQDLNQVHALFKHMVASRRPQMDLEQVATGEVWYGQEALERQLVDQLGTSDEYLWAQRERADIYYLEYRAAQTRWQRLGLSKLRGWLSSRALDAA